MKRALTIFFLLLPVFRLDPFSAPHYAVKDRLRFSSAFSANENFRQHRGIVAKRFGPTCQHFPSGETTAKVLRKCACAGCFG